MEYARCCKECVLNHNCLFQQNDDVESCQDYYDMIKDDIDENED